MTVHFQSFPDAASRACEPHERTTCLPRVGLISNPKSHLNKQRSRALRLAEGTVIKREPRSYEALVRALSHFAAESVDLIVIDGGDGTVRDVLTAAAHVYGEALPRLAVLPSGKTNALAIDLQIPEGWTLAEVIGAHQANHVRTREPISIHRMGTSLPDQLGFIFGSGAYVRATALAQRFHRFGWFNGIAIALAMTGAILQTFLGGPGNPWRRGETIRVSKDGQDIHSETVYLLLATTLKRMPLGLKPFGPVRRGLKFLAVKAPPRSLLRYLPRLLRGMVGPELEAAGYLRRDAERVFLSIKSGIILDGERYPGGNLAIGRGKAVEFVVP